MQKHFILWPALLADALTLTIPVTTLVNTRHRMVSHLASGESGETGTVLVEWRINCRGLISGFGKEAYGAVAYCSVLFFDCRDFNVVNIDHLAIKTHDSHEDSD